MRGAASDGPCGVSAGAEHSKAGTASSFLGRRRLDRWVWGPPLTEAFTRGHARGMKTEHYFRVRSDVLRNAYINAMRLERKGWRGRIGWTGRIYVWFHARLWLWVLLNVLFPARPLGSALWKERMFLLGCVGAMLGVVKLFFGS